MSRRPTWVVLCVLYVGIAAVAVADGAWAGAVASVLLAGVAATVAWRVGRSGAATADQAG